MRSYLKRAGMAISMGMMALAIGRPASAVSVIPINMQDTINQAGAIFTGRVLQAQSRWGTPEKRWMVTDYLFAVDDAILPDGNIQKGGQVVLTWPGGVIDGEGHGIRGLELPKVGNTYMLMLRKDWVESRMGPEVVPNHGLFRVVPNAGMPAPEIQEAEGQPLYKLSNGMIVRKWEVKAPGATRGVTLPAFSDWVRTNMARIKAMPYAAPAMANPNDPDEMPAPAKIAIEAPIVRHRVIVPEDQIMLPKSPLAPGEELPSPVAPAKGNPVAGSQVEALPGTSHNVAASPDKLIEKTFGINSTLRNANWSRFNMIPGGRLRIVWNPFPNPFSGWEFQDQHEMAKQNHWADIHRVMAPKGTWSWGDGTYDMTGWPSNATMIAQFGQGWGANTLAVCWTRWDGSGILESDVSHNPAFGWTLNNESIYNGAGSAWPFESTCMHEICHAWGLDHNFGFQSIMNYQQREFRAAPWQYMDDAEGMRATYPGYAPNHSALANYMYESTLDSSWSDVNMPGSVVAGNNITIDGHHIENLGNINLPNTPLDYYLTPARSWSTYTYIGGATYGALNRFFYFTPSAVDRTFTVPSTIASGWYYLASWSPTYADVPGNERWPWSQQSAWSRLQIYVYPRIKSVVISPTISPRNSVATGTVYLHGPSDGRSVSLSSSNTGMATVPSSVFVPAGATSANFNVTIPNGGTSGSSVITASLLGYSVNDTAYVSARTTLTGVNISAMIGQTVTLSGTLKRSFDNVAIAGETVYFYVDGNFVGSGVTSSTGKAVYKFKVLDSMALGNHTIEAVHFTNYSYYYSYAANILTVKKATTKLTFTDQSIPIGKNTVVKATLKRATDSAVLASQSVDFYENGNFVGTFTTNASGVASFNRKFDEPYGLGPVSYQVNYGGNTLYNSSTDTGTITVKQSPTTITIRGVSGTRGSIVVLSAILKRSSDAAVLNGRTLKFFVDGVAVGNATMVAGTAKLNYTIPAGMALGLHNVRVDFAGEAFYAASTKNGNYLTVK